MKRFTAQLSIIIAVLFALIGVIPSKSSGEYCPSQPTSSSYAWITEVELNDGINTSGRTEYSDYTGTTLTTLTQGQSNYTLTVKGSSYSAEGQMKAWIDFNQDGTFDTATEEIDLGSFTGTDLVLEEHELSSGVPTIPIPPLSERTTRMRVTIRKGSAAVLPCDNGDFIGEVEDYTIGIAEDSTRQLIISKNGTGTGTVTSGEVDPEPKKIDCGTTCSASYTEGDPITLTATADSNSIFVGWEGGGCSSTSAACSTTIYNNPHSTTATFDLPSNVLWTNPDTGLASLWGVDPQNGSLVSGLGFPDVPPTSSEATSFFYISDTMGYVLWTNPDTGVSALRKVNHQTGELISSIPFSVTPPSPWTATSFSYISSTLGYVLWTNPDTGAGSLWQVNPQTGEKMSGTAFSVVPPPPWTATSFAYISDTLGYVLWTNPDTGNASLWQVNPQTGALLSSAAFSVVPPSPWEATSFTYVSDTLGYVLWTNPSTGASSLWKVNPQTGARLSGSSFSIVPPPPWEATSFFYVSETVGYVLWTNLDTRVSSLWKVNPQTGAILSSTVFYDLPRSPWEATSFANVSDTLGYVLWTNPDTGAGSLRRINSQTGELVSSAAFGVQPPPPWTATSFVYISDTIGYVLWANPDTGAGSLWQVNPQTGALVSSTAFAVKPPPPWTATSFYYRGSSGQAAAESIGMLSEESMEIQNIVYLHKSGTGAGTIATDTQICRPDCDVMALAYEEGTSQTVETIPEESSIFVGWQLEDGSWLENIHYAQPGDVVLAVFEKQ